MILRFLVKALWIPPQMLKDEPSFQKWIEEGAAKNGSYLRVQRLKVLIKGHLHERLFRSKPPLTETVSMHHYAYISNLKTGQGILTEGED